MDYCAKNRGFGKDRSPFAPKEALWPIRGERIFLSSAGSKATEPILI